MKLDEILDVSEMCRLAEQHYLTMKVHPSMPLRIVNYTAKTQYERLWTNETELCRGLMFGSDNTIVSRPFRKFFNLGETPGQVVPDEPFTAYEKLDGSLGISYIDADGLPSLATRGSFISDQAKRGTEVLRRMLCEHDLNRLSHDCQGYTFLFEIILPENRIVVDYGGREDLVLLTVIETATGIEMPDWAADHAYAFARPKTWTYDSLTDVSDATEGPDFDGQEGVVVRFKSGLRLKVKRSEYVRLHRLVTGLTPRRIWGMLKEGDPVGRLFAGTSPGFQAWARGQIDQILAQYRAIADEATAEHGRILATAPADRKSYAIQAAKHAHAPILFKLYDQHSPDEIIWKRVKPGAADPFRVEV